MRYLIVLLAVSMTTPAMAEVDHAKQAVCIETAIDTAVAQGRIGHIPASPDCFHRGTITMRDRWREGEQLCGQFDYASTVERNGRWRPWKHKWFQACRQRDGHWRVKQIAD